jgi:hypothetical protein
MWSKPMSLNCLGGNLGQFADFRKKKYPGSRVTKSFKNKSLFFSRPKDVK